MAEIVDFQEIVRARTRRRSRVLTERCLDLMEACLADTLCAYDAASPAERRAWGVKIRQLEGLLDYAANWL